MLEVSMYACNTQMHHFDVSHGFYGGPPSERTPPRGRRRAGRPPWLWRQAGWRKGGGQLVEGLDRASGVNTVERPTANFGGIW